MQVQIARICAFGLKDIFWPGFSAFGKIQLHSQVRLNNILYRDDVHDPFVCISYNNIYICKHSYIYIYYTCMFIYERYIHYNAWRNDINILYYMHYTISGLPSFGACYTYTVPRGEGAVIATMDSGNSLRLPSTPHWPLA